MGESRGACNAAMPVPESKGEPITFPAGTRVSIDGMPFWLPSATALLGKKANVALIRPEPIQYGSDASG